MNNDGVNMDNGSYIDLNQKLSDFYFKKVQPKLATYNKLRRKKALNKILIAAISITFISLYFTIYIPIVNIITISIFVILFITIKIINKSKKHIDINIEHDIKCDLMNDFVKIFGDLHWHNAKNFNNVLTENNSNQMQQFWKDIDKVNKLNLFNIFSLEFDDCIEGSYKNIPFEIKEVKIIPPIFKAIACLPFLVMFGPFTLIFIIIGLIALLISTLSIVNLYDNFISTLIKYGSSKVLAAIIAATIFVIAIKVIADLAIKLFRRISTSFRGIIVEFAMNKNFEGHTFILDNTKDGKAIFVDKNKYSEVKLEDIEFTQDYTVWSDNQIEARYLLTTALIERLKNLKSSFKAKYTRVSFKDNKIIIAVHTGKDMFKMADMFSETGKETFIELFNEILSVLDLIEQLKLNQKLGL